MGRQKFRVMERPLTTADEMLCRGFDLIISTVDEQSEVEVALSVVAYTSTKLIGVGWNDVLAMIEADDSSRFGRAHVLVWDGLLSKILTEKITLLTTEEYGSSFLIIFLPERIDDIRNIVEIDKIITSVSPSIGEASLQFTASLCHWRSSVVVIGFCPLIGTGALEAGAARHVPQ